MMLMTPVTKSKQEKADSKNFDILRDCRGMQCSLNCKDTEIQWLIISFPFQSTPYLIYGIGSNEQRNDYNQPQRAHNSS